MTQRSPVTRIGAQHAAQHELAKSIYHRNSEPIPVRVLHWAEHLVDRALHSTFTGHDAPSGNFGALALVVIVAAVVVVVIWRVGVPRRATSTGAVLPPGRAVSAADHRALSATAADQADWHTAVIERMRAIARELEERSVLQPRAGRTATELTDEAGAILPGAATDLRQAAAIFNAIAYGAGEATPADLEVLAAADDDVRHSVRSKALAT
jgi:hypothetical protein